MENEVPMNTTRGALIGSGQLGQDRDELTSAQVGQWLVLSRTSAHFFDLDAMLVTRIPGYEPIEMITDGGRELRSIEGCRVGESGLWTMEPMLGERDIEYRWHQSTEIVRIVEVLGLDQLPGLPDPA